MQHGEFFDSNLIHKTARLITIIKKIIFMHTENACKLEEKLLT